jgi:cell shape-determining protein MreC
LQATMTYLLQPKPPKQTAARNAIRAVSVIAVVVFLFSALLPNAFPRVFGTIATPLWKLRTAMVSNVSGLHLLSSREEIIKENERLSSDNARLNLDALKLELLASENNELRSLLNMNQALRRVVASVLVYPSQTHYDILVVDKVEGIDVGSLVLSGPVALGSVVEDLGTSIKVSLFSSPGVLTEARVISSGSPIALKGRGGGNFTAVVPRDFQIEVGNILILPNRQSIAIAKVEHIEEAETDSFKLVRATVPLNIFSLRFIEIESHE